jgi:hypothetical protein
MEYTWELRKEQVEGLQKVPLGSLERLGFHPTRCNDNYFLTHESGGVAIDLGGLEKGCENYEAVVSARTEPGLEQVKSRFNTLLAVVSCNSDYDYSTIPVQQYDRLRRAA